MKHNIIASQTIVIAMGSNLDFKGFLPADILYFAQTEIEIDVGHIIKASKIYSSPPWPEGAKGNDYFNQVILLDGEKIDDAAILIPKLHKIENQFGRVRDSNDKWAPRTLDLDIIDFKNQIISTKDLQIPHPRFRDRSFVLSPLYEIYPEYIHPETFQRVLEMMANLELLNDYQSCEPVLDT